MIVKIFGCNGDDCVYDCEKAGCCGYYCCWVYDENNGDGINKYVKDCFLGKNPFFSPLV